MIPPTAPMLHEITSALDGKLVKMRSMQRMASTTDTAEKDTRKTITAAQKEHGRTFQVTAGACCASVQTLESPIAAWLGPGAPSPSVLGCVGKKKNLFLFFYLRTLQLAYFSRSCFLIPLGDVHDGGGCAQHE